ncbi:MAG: tetratricopeptide repeat protein [Acidobacteriota bacterium]
MFRLFLCTVLALPLLAKTPEWEPAQKLLDADQFKQAAVLLEKAPQNDPDNLQLLGEAYFGLKDFKRAIDVLDRAAGIAPARSMIHLWLGRAWGRRAESNKFMALSWARKAKDAFERAVNLDNKNVEALDDLFEYYVSAPGIVGGGLDKAETVAKQVASIDPAKGQRLLSKVAEERRK